MRLKMDNGPAALVELKPDLKLLDPNFSGYKLSLSSIPIHTVNFETRVNKVGPCENQFSLQHVTLFATQNLLFANPRTPNAVYYIGEDWKVWKVSINPLNGRMCNPTNVWTLPGNENRNYPGRFNVSLVFPSSGYGLLADGCGNIVLLGIQEDDRQKWVEIFRVSNELLKSSVLLDSVLNVDGDTERIDLLFMRIEEKTGFIEEHHLQQHKDLVNGDHTFLNVIEWLSLQKDGDNPWKIKSKRTLAGQTGVYYGYLEPGGNSCYIASDAPFHYTYDSEHLVELPKTEEVPDLEKKPDYLWSQTKDKVIVWFSLALSSSRDDVDVNAKSDSISVTYRNEIILQGSPHQHIDPDTVLWTLETGKLEITLRKSQENLMWSELIPGNLAGEHIVDEETVQSIHSRLAHLCSDKWEASTDKLVLADNDFDEQLEECDRLADEFALFMRFSKSSHSITHQVSITTHPVLFAVRVDPEKSPHICMRFHHDGLIWQSEESTPSSGGDPNLSIRHIGTFSALGYVQAGKSQRKFTVCSSDLSYVALCDARKHIYIYRRPEPVTNELRNRKTGAHVKHIANQQVIGVDPPVEILGSVAFPEFLFILTSNHLHAFKVRESSDDEVDLNEV